MRREERRERDARRVTRTRCLRCVRDACCCCTRSTSARIWAVSGVGQRTIAAGGSGVSSAAPAPSRSSAAAHASARVVSESSAWSSGSASSRSSIEVSSCISCSIVPTPTCGKVRCPGVVCTSPSSAARPPPKIGDGVRGERCSAPDDGRSSSWAPAAARGGGATGSSVRASASLVLIARSGAAAGVARGSGAVESSPHAERRAVDEGTKRGTQAAAHQQSCCTPCVLESTRATR